MPYFMAFWTQGEHMWNRWRDSGGCSSLYDVKSTKAITIQEFLTIHSGVDAQLHCLFAAVTTQVYVTFMYGLALPILFPILAVAMINTYLVERLMFAYAY